MRSAWAEKETGAPPVPIAADAVLLAAGAMVTTDAADSASMTWPRLQGGFFFGAQTLGADVYGVHGGLIGAGDEGGGSGRCGAELRYGGGGQAGGGGDGDGDDGNEDGFHVFSDVHDGVLWVAGCVLR